MAWGQPDNYGVQNTYPMAQSWANGNSYTNTPAYSQAAVQQPTRIIADWAQGEAGARGYRLPPDTLGVLLDAENDIMYIKAVDRFGMPAPLRIFDVKERFTDQRKLPQNSQQSEPAQRVDMANYITKEEFDKRLNEELAKRLDELTK